VGVGLFDAALDLRRVVPVEVEDRPVLGILRARELLPDPLAQVVHEPEFGATVALGLDRLVAPLQEPLGVGKRALLLHVGGRRQEEHLRLYVLGFQLAGLYLGRVVPEGGGLRLHEVPDHEPFEVGEGEPLELAVGGADGGVLAHHEKSLAPAVYHAHDRRVDGVLPRQARQMVEAEVVLFGGRIAPVGLQETHRVGLHVAPVAARRGVTLHELLQTGVRVGVGHGDVAGQDVEEGGDIGRALDGRVPPQGHDAAAGPTYVAQEELDDGGGADVLDAVGMLRPSDRVGEGGGPIPARVVAHRIADPQEEVLGDAAHLLNHLRGVAGVVPLQDLEDAAGVLEGLVHLRGLAVLEGAALRVVGLLAGRPALLAPSGRALSLHALVLPGRRIVGARLGIPAGEDAVEVLRVRESLAHDDGRVGVSLDVFVEPPPVLEDVVDYAAEESYVRAGPDGHVHVGDGARPRVARVDVDHGRPPQARLHHPLEAYGVVLGHVGADVHDAVGVCQVLLEGGGPAPTERGPETRDRGGVSYPGLVLYLDGPHRGEELLYEVVLLVVKRGTAEVGEPEGAVQVAFLLVFVLPGLLSGLY
jgi:hypothetical protein